MSTTAGACGFPPLKTPEDRAVYVAEHFDQCGKNIAPQVIKLRADFRALKPGEEIMGCATWTMYCKHVLKLTIRALQYKLKGGNLRREKQRKAR